MTLRLTPDLLAAAYDFLRTTEPFKGWKLPESDDLGFKVRPLKDRFGHFQGDNRPDAFPDIVISNSHVVSTLGLMEVMSHEMIHQYQDIRGTYSRRVEHNAEFKRLAGAVCREHGFNPNTFIE